MAGGVGVARACWNVLIKQLENRMHPAWGAGGEELRDDTFVTVSNNRMRGLCHFPERRGGGGEGLVSQELPCSAVH